MPRIPPRLAKLTRPVLHGVVPRERLFGELEAARLRPVVWVEGPPGSGKTTLVASDLEARSVPAIWYQADAGDADVATFYHYLRYAARAAGLNPPALLSPQYLPDLDGFARRFFRQLFARMPAGAALVLDNWQEVSSSELLSRALAIAAEEVPTGSNLFVVSREAPPAQLARSVANGRVATLGWLQLRLTRSETASLLACQGNFDGESVEQVHERANGWAAGVTLLLEECRSVSGSPALGETAAESTFGYFATQILDSADPELRRLLLHVSVFPWITAEWGAAVSGVADAARWLDDLHRRNLFVERRGAQRGMFQFHALFRAFLVHRAGEVFGPGGLSEVRAAAATCMASSGHADEAFALLCEAYAWVRAAGLFVESAPGLIANGRLQTVREWAARIPRDVAQSNPWVDYWFAASTAPVRPDDACELFACSFDAFRRIGDADGETACAAGMLDAIYMQYADFTRMDPWIEILWAAVKGRTAWPSSEFELRVQSALLVSTCLRVPGHPAVRPAAEHVVRLLGRCRDVNLRVWAAIRLCSYLHMTADFELAFAPTAAAGGMIEHPDLVPPIAAEFSHVLGYAYYLRGDYATALSWYGRALRIVDAEGLVRLKHWILSMRAACERRTGDIAAAQRTLAELASAPAPHQGAVLALYRIVRALTLASQGCTAAAVEEGLASQRAIEAAGAVGLQALNCLHNSDILLAAGDECAARTRLAEARSLIAGTSMDALRGTIALNQAYLAHRTGDVEPCRVWLREALESMRSEVGRARARWYGDALSELCALALREEIEPALVRFVIRELRVKPGPGADEHWPWPVRIRALGAFELIKDDAPVRFEHKVPRKPIAVLKALIASGGSGMPASLVCDWLWPDLDGDAALEAFRTALHRLRRLLGAPDLVTIEDGILSLDRTRVWVDVFAFQCAEKNGSGLDRMLGLYRGEFLQDEREAAWPLPMRGKLRQQLVSVLTEAAQMQERSGDVESAIALYERGIQADQLAETLHQGLIRCRIRQGRLAEAGAAYGRCRQFLLGGLGVPPSQATLALARSIGASGV